MIINDHDASQIDEAVLLKQKLHYLYMQPVATVPTILIYKPKIMPINDKYKECFPYEVTSSSYGYNKRDFPGLDKTKTNAVKCFLLQLLK